MVRTYWLVAAMILGACGADPGATEDPADFDSGDTQEQRATSWQALVGAWQTERGGPYQTLVFQNTVDGTGHHFFGMRQVVCVRAPCNPVREDGSFTAGTSLLTLRASGAVQRLRYRLSGERLTILVGTTTLQTLTRVRSYCTAAQDCSSQGLPGVRCLGAWGCEQNACTFHCGSPRPSCTTLTCAPGYHCEMDDGGGSCVADGSGGYGAMCGGIAGLRCAVGFTCVLEARHPDASGACHPLSAEGGPCGGGSTRYPAVCGEGLSCDGPAAGAPLGAMGVCRRMGPTCATLRCAAGYRCVMRGAVGACVADGDHGYGTFCGGIAAIQCDAGFTCVLDARTPDSGGVCHPLSGEGGPCGGGSTRFPAVCGSGLTCQGPAAGAPSGALGTCVRATPTCATVRCASGYRCVMVSGAARCVTN